jgi:hypothetical protein
MSRTLNKRDSTRIVFVLLAVVVVLAAALGAIYLSQYPARQTADLHRKVSTASDLEFDKRVQLQTSILQYETDNRIKIWTTIVQAAGGAALLVGLLFTARNLRATQGNLIATQEKLEIDHQGQLTNRFIQATGQLGAMREANQPNIEVRLGGIYALNRIFKDWPSDYWLIANVLTAYVRHNARWTSSSAQASDAIPGTDIQAILTVLGHDPPPSGFDPDHKFDLRNTDLRGAELYNANLQWTDFWGAHLEGAQLWAADLRGAKLERAHLAGANLRGAHLEGASLEQVDVTGASFDELTVWPTGFDARLSGAMFIQ